MADFVHLHVHTEYSMLDGLGKIPNLIEKTLKNNQKSLAITDHGGMYGAVSFYNSCKKAGIKPIIGVEVYMAKDSRFDKQSRMGSDQSHLVLLAMNHRGYVNLMHLVSAANLEGFSYKPRIDFELLKKYSSDIIVTSACASSIFNRLIRDGKDDEAIEWFKKFKDLFGDRFYIELQRHQIDFMEEMNNKL
ncbi:MAG: PHP domain-containing protein, partial [Candidatus Pacebacteria bacterium]|nr:PHP domain-containing protein [Candidatus Paceibacterota bacterium]MBT7309328.1 PHP domain-containing protein [Candidatus Paceibacterota bacterium]